MENAESGETCEARGGPSGPKSLQAIQKRHIEGVLEMTGFDLENSARILAIRVGELRQFMGALGIRGRENV